jgi:hypothetical protein
MQSNRLAALFLGTVAAFSFASSSSALEVHTYSVVMTGAQEVPPVATAGLGTCIVTLDDVSGVVTVSGSFSGLTTSATLAHVHGLAGAGANAGILITLSETGGTSGSVSGSGTLSPANVTGMLGGLTYLNIHTTMHAGGEIRGQITASVPSMSWYWVIALAVIALGGGAYLVARRVG